MKFFIFTFLFIAFTINNSIQFKSNDLSLANIDYLSNSTKVHYNFKYSNMTINYEVEDSSNLDSTIFKFIWSYACDDEKTKGSQIAQAISASFEDVSEDNGLVITFKGKDVQELKSYRESEFGGVYSLTFNQKQNPIQFQFLIRAKQPNQEEFHDIIKNITDSRKSNCLNFLHE